MLSLICAVITEVYIAVRVDVLNPKRLTHLFEQNYILRRFLKLNDCFCCCRVANQRRIGSGRIARHDSQDDERGGFRREIPNISELRKEAARDKRGGNGFHHNDRGNGFGNRRMHEFDDEVRVCFVFLSPRPSCL